MRMRGENMLGFRCTLLLSCLCSLVLFSCEWHEGLVRKQRPNVLLISIDDLNDWVGVLDGHSQARTPNMDQLASQGVLFANAHAQAPVCTPSRASLFSGRLPSSTGLYFLRPTLRESEVTRDGVTLVERFAQEGYETIGVGKTYGVDDRRYFQRSPARLLEGSRYGPVREEKISYPQGHRLWDWGAFPAHDSLMPDAKIADWAIEQIRKEHDKPVFLAVGFMRPHVPMYVPQKWFDLHPIEAVKLPATLGGDRDDLPAYARDLTIGTPAPRHEWLLEQGEWKHAVRSYLASTTFVDHHVGRVLDALEESDLAGNTIVVLFSDHGFHLGEKQRWAKRSLWEEVTRVPLIVAAPGLERDVRSDRAVGLIDLYPTLLELAGLAPDPALEGQSLVPLLEDPDDPWERPAITTFGRGNHSVRSQHWRYTRYADGSEELYDHRKDSDEWVNLAGDPAYADVIEEYEAWLPEINHPILEGHDSSGLEAYLQAEKKASFAPRKVGDTTGR